MLKKITSVLLLIIFLVINSFSSMVKAQAYSDGTIISFKDQNLESAVRQTIKKDTGDIYYSDVKDIYTLDASNRSISDLTGIEYFTGLYNLYIGGNNISDLSPVASLSNISYLDASDNNIISITPLSSLLTLNTLDLRNNKISDITDLKGLTNLTFLNLQGNLITTISSLINLTNLENLNLEGNKLISFENLKSLINLKYLYITGTGINDLTPLSTLSELTELAAGENQITDISPLSSLKNIQNLLLNNNKICDITPLSNLTNLTQLWLSSNKISDTVPLGSLKSLKELMLNDNCLTEDSLSGIMNLKSLNYLDLSDNPINNIDMLKKNPYNFPYLKALNLWGIMNKTEGISTEVYPGLYDQRQVALQSKIKDIINNIVTPDMTDLEKVLAIHDYVVSNTLYSGEDTSVGADDLIMKHKAFCSTYTNAMDTLLSAAGIEIRAIGGEGHAWNMVKIDDDYYHIDATWDDEMDTGFNYNYFLLSDAEIENLRSGPMFDWDSPNSGLRNNKDQPCNSIKYDFLRSMLNRFDGNRGQITVKGNWIYYADDTDNNTLYMIAIDGTQKTKISDDNCSNLKINGNYVYYINKNDGNEYKINIDGTGRQPVSQLKVISSEPSECSNIFPVDGSIKLNFNSNINLTDGSLISLKNSRGASMPVTYEVQGNILTITPKCKLLGVEEYTLSVPENSIQGQDGRTMDGDYSLHLSTADVNIPAPVIDLDGDVYFKPINVNLSSTSGKIYYTADGTDPTAESTQYTAPISIDKYTVLKYLVVDSNGNQSQIFTQIYVIDGSSYDALVQPDGNVVKKTNMNGVISVNFNCTSVDHAIYFTCDGSTPTVNSLKSGSYGFFPGQTLKYIIADKAGNTSPAFEVQFKVADINNDKIVDIKDIASVASNYNIINNNPNWSDNYDLNNDGVIDIYDLTAISRLLD